MKQLEDVNKRLQKELNDKDEELAKKDNIVKNLT